MELVRKRLKWAATVILAIGLVSQIAQGQAARCDAMNLAGSMTPATSHAHHSADSVPKSESGSSRHHNSPASANCIQSALCLGNAALPEVPARAIARAAHAAVIESAPPVIEARDLRPDSPPPKN